MNQSLGRTGEVKFGPWAIVTGASSGIGEEFARQLGAHRINLVLVARRLALLNELGARLIEAYGVECKSIALDLSQENFIDRIHDETKDLDIGLLCPMREPGSRGDSWIRTQTIFVQSCG
jgi:short-subunit dehydrogenase